MNYSNHLMGHQTYKLFVFPINMSHLQILEVSLMLLQGSKPFTFWEIWHRMCLLEWLASLVSTFWLLHWDHLYFHNQGLMGMWISLWSRETYYFLTHVFSFLTRMWMISWKGMCGKPEIVHLCCENNLNPLKLSDGQLG